ncbi:SUKH-4 family immunity protein [Tundrisphaera sp. TA3]|uniref:SUKH-4 family immunity protein n=1 Tax=Tundrisphaera sp. TA3 TaxID=3435775 RepID=UPI003EB7F69C
MDLAAIGAEVALKLPEQYEPLLLTFYGVRTRTKGQFAVIGDDEGTEFCIEPSTGSVLSIDFEGQVPTRFVNSSIGQLSRFVDGYADYARRVGLVQSEEEAAAMVRELRERLLLIDAGAFETPECWWTLVLEQAEDGLL